MSAPRKPMFGRPIFITKKDDAKNKDDDKKKDDDNQAWDDDNQDMGR